VPRGKYLTETKDGSYKESLTVSLILTKSSEKIVNLLITNYLLSWELKSLQPIRSLPQGSYMEVKLACILTFPEIIVRTLTFQLPEEKWNKIILN